MKQLLAQITGGFNFTNSIKEDSYNLFVQYGQEDTAKHCVKVANEAKRLAKLFGLDNESALTASFLHDIGRLLPGNIMVEAAYELGIEVLEEELAFPEILHQKISRVLAKELFEVKDAEVLNAIECHTTLRSKAKSLDMVLFLADKLSWDREFNQQFINKVNEGLNKSLEHACYGHIKYLYDNRENLKVLHPWTKEAYIYLTQKLKGV